MGRRGGGAMSPAAIERMDKEQQAVALRRAGRTYEEIAAEVGYANRGAAHKAVQRGLTRWVREGTEELRALELERTEALIARLWPGVDNPEGFVDLPTLDRLLKVLDLRARLAGLYAPKRQQVGVDVTVGPGVRATPRSVLATSELDELIDELVARRGEVIDL